MPSRFQTYDLMLGEVDLDDVFITDETFVDRYGKGSYLWGWGEWAVAQKTVGVDQSSPIQIGTTADWKIIERTGSYTALALKMDGSLWGWGENRHGSLLDKAAINDVISSPTLLMADKTWKFITGSHYYASVYGITVDEKVWVWGYNFYGKMGLGDEIHRSSPVQLGSAGEWKIISSQFERTHLVKNDGSIWTIGAVVLGGSNFPGGFASSPVQVGTSYKFKIMKSSDYMTSTITTDNELVNWGANFWAQCGSGNMDFGIERPFNVGFNTSDWKTTSVDGNSGFAIRMDGSLWGWGVNLFGTLGLGEYITVFGDSYVSSPVQIGNLKNWKSVESGIGSFHAIKTDGTLWTSGYNYRGRLGLGNTVDRSSPTQVGNLSDWKTISAAAEAITALKYSNIER